MTPEELERDRAGLEQVALKAIVLYALDAGGARGGAMAERTRKRILAFDGWDRRAREVIAVLMARRRPPAALVRWLYEALDVPEPQPRAPSEHEIRAELARRRAQAARDRRLRAVMMTTEPMVERRRSELAHR